MGVQDEVMKVQKEYVHSTLIYMEKKPQKTLGCLLNKSF